MCLYEQICVRVCVFIFIYVCVRVYAFVYVYMLVSLCMCVCVFYIEVNLISLRPHRMFAYVSANAIIGDNNT